MTLPDWAGYRRFRPGFAEAMDPAFYPIEYLDALLLSGRARLWVGAQAAIVAEIRDYPGGARVVHGLVAAGRIEEIQGQLIPLAEAWGRAQGCSRAIVESRSGWMRALRAQGYEPHQVALRKDLTVPDPDRLRRPFAPSPKHEPQ
jgi:hypothetical protein